MDFRVYKEVQSALGISDYSNKIIHYTSFENLSLMLESGELWFGHISNMNDTAECSHFISGVESSLRDIFDKISFSSYFSIIENAKNSIEKDTFISSWCEYTNENAEGLLPMWQEYGKNGRGVGLIIDSSIFQPSRLKPENLNFFIFSSKVKYLKKESAIEYADNLVKRLFSKVKLYNENMDLFVTAIMMLAAAPTIKHPSFSHEREIRFISMDPIPSLRPMRGDMSLVQHKVGDDVRSYRRLKLHNYPESGFDLTPSRLVKAVLVGPGDDQGERNKQVRELLDRHSLRNVKVINSAIPYRRR